MNRQTVTNLASQKLSISLMVFFFFWPIKLLGTSREMTFTRDIKQAHVTRNLTAWYTPRCVTLDKCDIKLFFRTFGLDITCFNLALTSNQPKEICEYRCHKLKTNMKRNLRYTERWIGGKKDENSIPSSYISFSICASALSHNASTSFSSIFNASLHSVMASVGLWSYKEKQIRKNSRKINETKQWTQIVRT